ncbi:MAG: hypothetical protein ACYTG6_04025, partial [Planctomycetota bacterium]
DAVRAVRKGDIGPLAAADVPLAEPSREIDRAASEQLRRELEASVGRTAAEALDPTPLMPPDGPTGGEEDDR